MPVYKAEGIVLRRHAIGEADRTVTLFTREYGKVRAVARGTRRTSSRLGGRLEPLTHARFLLARGRSLDVIAQVDVVHTFAGLRTALLRSAYASYVAELVDRFLPERDRQDEVFELVLDVLDALERAGEDEVEVQALWFALRLISDLGYRPEVEACVGCGRALPRGAAGSVQAWAFNPAHGGALCPECASGDPLASRVAPGVLAACGYLLRTAPGGAARLRLPPGARRELSRLVQMHLEHQLDAKLKAPLVIGRLRESP
jgi:DNA repair protein RecO (recombination protein O)